MESFKKNILNATLGFSIGLFPTLVAGTILFQIGLIFGGDIGQFLIKVATLARGLIGVGIGIGVAIKMDVGGITVASAAVAGYIGEISNNIQDQQSMIDVFKLEEASVPLCAFLAAFVTVMIGKIIGEENKFSYLFLPVISVFCGAMVSFVFGKYALMLLEKCENVIDWAGKQSPMITGMVVSAIVCIACTIPIGTVAIASTFHLSGIAASAAVVGCCSSMIGYALASYDDNKDNKISAVVLQTFGTSSLQLPNIISRPITFVPVLIASIVAGAVSTGLDIASADSVSQLSSYGIIAPFINIINMGKEKGVTDAVFMRVLIIQFVVPAMIARICSTFMRKSGVIEDGDMKVSI